VRSDAFVRWVIAAGIILAFAAPSPAVMLAGGGSKREEGKIEAVGNVHRLGP
jgi:hypothetical protein